MHPKGKVIHKGINPNIDSYSAFFDNAKLGKTSLADLMTEEGIDDVYVCGIATDVCVASTAFHANELGFRTILVDDCSRGIKEENIANSYSKLRTEFACVVQSSEVRHDDHAHHHDQAVPGEGHGAGEGQEAGAWPEACTGVQEEYQVSCET